LVEVRVQVGVTHTGQTQGYKSAWVRTGAAFNERGHSEVREGATGWKA